MNPRPRVPLDEHEVARRLALGYTQTYIAEFFDTNAMVIWRRIKFMRSDLKDFFKTKNPALALWWMDEATPAQVAGRWLLMKTNQDRWRAFSDLDSDDR